MDDSNTQQGASDTSQVISDKQQVMGSQQQAVGQVATLGVGAHKEHEPMIITAEVMAKPDELIAPSQPEVVIPKEVAEAGVKKVENGGEVKLDRQVEQAGVTHAPNESAPVQTGLSGSVTLPLPYQKAIVLEKKTRIGFSLKWLAGEIAYQWKKMKPDIYQ